MTEAQAIAAISGFGGSNVEVLPNVVRANRANGALLAVSRQGQSLAQSVDHWRVWALK